MRAEKRRQMREVGYHRSPKKRGSRAALRPPSEKPTVLRNILPGGHRSGLIVVREGLITP